MGGSQTRSSKEKLFVDTIKNDEKFTREEIPRLSSLSTQKSSARKDTDSTLVKLLEKQLKESFEYITTLEKENEELKKEVIDQKHKNSKIVQKSIANSIKNKKLSLQKSESSLTFETLNEKRSPEVSVRGSQNNFIFPENNLKEELETKKHDIELIKNDIEFFRNELSNMSHYFTNQIKSLPNLNPPKKMKHDVNKENFKSSIRKELEKSDHKNIKKNQKAIKKVLQNKHRKAKSVRIIEPEPPAASNKKSKKINASESPTGHRNLKINEKEALNKHRRSKSLKTNPIKNQKELNKNESPTKHRRSKSLKTSPIKKQKEQPSPKKKDKVVRNKSKNKKNDLKKNSTTESNITIEKKRRTNVNRRGQSMAIQLPESPARNATENSPSVQKDQKKKIKRRRSFSNCISPRQIIQLSKEKDQLDSINCEGSVELLEAGEVCYMMSDEDDGNPMMESVRIRRKWDPKLITTIFNKICDRNERFEPPIPLCYVAEICGVAFERDWEETLASERLSHVVSRLCGKKNIELSGIRNPVDDDMDGEPDSGEVTIEEEVDWKPKPRAKRRPKMFRLKKGDVIILKENMGTGKVRYLGKVTGYARGQWIGLEMIEGVGNCDGAVHGKRYFKCPRKKGWFIQQKDIESKHK